MPTTALPPRPPADPVEQEPHSIPRQRTATAHGLCRTLPEHLLRCQLAALIRLALRAAGPPVRRSPKAGRQGQPFAATIQCARRDRPGYGSDEFARASELIAAAAQCTSWAALLRLGWSRWRDAHLAAVQLGSLPQVSVATSATAAGDRLHRHLERRRYGLRLRALSIAAVTIPQDPQLLLRGRSAQAMRTNLRRAAQLGTSYHKVSGTPAECAQLLVLCAKSGLTMNDADIAYWISQRPDLFVAVDAQGAYVTAYCLDVDTDVALLERVMMAGRDGRYARYGLHHRVVTELAERGVRLLCVGPAYGLPPRLLYLQHLLGFRPVHVVTVPALDGNLNRHTPRVGRRDRLARHRLPTRQR